jgi:hypothetical protein
VNSQQTLWWLILSADEQLATNLVRNGLLRSPPVVSNFEWVLKGTFSPEIWLAFTINWFYYLGSAEIVPESQTVSVDKYDSSVKLALTSTGAERTAAYIEQVCELCFTETESCIFRRTD